MNSPKSDQSPDRSPSSALADPTVQWRADLIYPLCWASLLAALLSTAASVLYLGGPTIASGSTVLLAIPIIGAIHLTKQGKVQAGAWVLSLSAFALLTAAAVWFATVTDVAHLFAIATVIAGLALGTRALIALAALAITLVVSLISAENAGWLPPPLHQGGTSNTIIALIAGIAMAAWTTSRAMASARRAREAWRSTHAELQAVLDSLEDTVEQRTADLRQVNARLHDEIAVRSLIQADLVDARDEAETAAKTKSQFVANVSHEIRTPLNGIIGVADLLALEDLSPAIKTHVETIRTSGALMKGLVEDVLDFSQLEADRLELEEVDFNLSKVIDAALAPLRVSARSRGLGLEVQLDGDLPPRLRGDPRRLSQVVTNLVGNAIKFTTEGQITVDASLHGFRPEGVLVRFAVRDTGVGMTPQDIHRIFEPFVQGDSSTTRRYGGTGLGLTIAKQLVERLGGTISVTSEQGSGSTFEFTVMLHESKTQHSVELESPWRLRNDAPPLDILVVEDNTVNQMVTTAMLKRLGHRYTVVADGLTALDRLSSATFDVVLMDCQMPGIDGLETCRRLRGAPGPNRYVPVVALTAHDSDEQREQTKAAGMDSFLAKPVEFSELAELLAALGSRLERASAVSGAIAIDLAELDSAAASAELDGKTLSELRALESVKPGLLAKMARLYLEQTPARIEAAEQTDDPESRANIAHTIKGSSMSFGASDVGRAAAAIERAARAAEASDEHFPALKAAFEAIRPAVQALADAAPGS